MELKKIDYSKLNARQKENFNFQKISAVLAEYGFVTFRLSDDWQGADFIALHSSGQVLRVQLKSRLAVNRKYQGKEIHVAFPNGSDWYLCGHDELLARILPSIERSKSWQIDGGYSFPRLSRELLELIREYRITGDTQGVVE